MTSPKAARNYISHARLTPVHEEVIIYLLFITVSEWYSFPVAYKVSRILDYSRLNFLA